MCRFRVLMPVCALAAGALLFLSGCPSTPTEQNRGQQTGTGLG